MFGSAILRVTCSCCAACIRPSSTDNACQILQLWNANSFQLLATFEGTGTALDRFYCVAVSHDGTMVVGGTLSNVILVYEISRPANKFSLAGHNGAVLKVRFGPPGTPSANLLFSCSKDMNLRRWSIGSRQCEKVYKGNTLLAQQGGSSPTVVDGKRGHNNEVLDFSFSPDGRRFCAVGHKGILMTDRDQTKLWDVASGNCVYNYKGHTQNVGAVVASKDGKRFYTAGHDSMIKAWFGDPDLSSSDHQKNRKLSGYRMALFQTTVI